MKRWLLELYENPALPGFQPGDRKLSVILEAPTRDSAIYRAECLNGAGSVIDCRELTDDKQGEADGTRD